MSVINYIETTQTGVVVVLIALHGCERTTDRINSKHSSINSRNQMLYSIAQIKISSQTIIKMTDNCCNVCLNEIQLCMDKYTLL